MIKKYFFFFLIIISCSKEDQLKVDINAFLKEGDRIFFNKLPKSIDLPVHKIDKLKVEKYFNYSNWMQKNYNASNIILPSAINIDRVNKSLSGKFQQILINNKKIFTIDSKSKLQVYDLNFKKLYSKKIYNRKVYNNYDLNFEMLINNNSIFISDNLGNIQSYNVNSLKKNWLITLGVPFRSNLKIYKGNIFLINSNSKIFAIDSDKGLINWSFETSSQYLKNNNSYKLAIHNDNLYFTNDSAELICLNLSNKTIQWSLNIEPFNYQTKPMIFETGYLSIDDKNNLFFSSNYGFIYSMNANSGQINWAKPINTKNKLIFANKYMVSISKKKLIILDKANGSILFNQDVTKSFKNSKELNLEDVFIGRNEIFIFLNNGELITLNLSNLKIIKKRKISNSFKEYIVYMKNIYILTNKNILKY